MAHLKTLVTNNQPSEREQSKWNLVRSLYGKGYQKQQLVKLFQFLEMTIPVELQQSFEDKLARYEEGTTMPIMSNIEERAAKSTARESVITVVRLRFGELSPELLASINSILELSVLKKLHEQAVIANSLEEFEEFLTSQPALDG